jgi:hypothetical protein
MNVRRRSVAAGLGGLFGSLLALDARACAGDGKAPAISLGPEIMSEFQRRRMSEGRLWAEGYSQAELDAAQEKFGLRFPPDLVALLRERRPVLGYDWRTDETEIRAMMRWPLEGLLFDVENDHLWWAEWGERPATEGARAEVLAAVVRAAPPLIPLVSHRYLPAEPCESGNPVFSVYQSDVIYYGADLEDYFEREFAEGPPGPVDGNVKRIRFWSDLVERR